MSKEIYIKILSDQLNASIKVFNMVLDMVNEGYGNSKTFEILKELQTINNELFKQLSVLKNNTQEL